jgi:mono/diheme cytochrome c family protein
MSRIIVMGFALAVGAQAARMPADSARGERLFTSLACVQCHSVNGKGGSVAPDLGKLTDRNFNPSTLASTMWNHAPAMWASMRTLGISLPDLNEQGAADLFAYFYTARFFERPADAGRGKRAFTEKHCAECHGVTHSIIPEAKPILEWTSAGNPIDLVTAMWNHAATMRQEFSKRKIAWPELTSQDLADILIYVRNMPGSRASSAARLEITAGPEGEQLFTNKGCAGCHNGKLTLADRLKGQTLTDIGVDMWNHSSKMAPVPPILTADQMRDLASYLWAGQFFQDSGSASAGRRVFAQKQCATCHENAQSGAPKLAVGGGSFSGSAMVAVLWHHGPQMQEMMRAKNIAWPRFDGMEMADLIAFLNSGTGSSANKKSP